MNVIGCYINWNVQPVAFSIGTLDILYYGLFLVAAFFSASFIFYIILKKENKSVFLLPITLNAVFLSALIGARLGECIFYFPEYYFHHPLEIFFPFKNGEFTGIGGLSSHGAALAIPVGLFLVAKSRKLSFIWLIDRVCIAIALAAVFIRLGNLMNSEILGTETTLPWGFVFGSLNESFPRHPVQLYEAMCYLITFFILFGFYNSMKYHPPKGVLLGLFLLLIFSSRFIIELFKAPLNKFDYTSLLTTGQYLSLLFIFAGAIILMISAMSKNKISG